MSRRSRATRPAPVARREPPATRRRAPADRADDADRLLPPWERGPVRAFVRDAVDARGPRPLLLLFMPAFALALITIFGPASELGRWLLLGSLAVLAVVAVDALLLGSQLVRAARRAFPGTPVPAAGTCWYVFMRAHRPRSMRRPPPR